ncbi:MAG TPA: hypothetical protein VFS10_12410 [Pyrinomonadaceae bacterium]|nr:hypothetical protein [Pyrinomonadaceae bacterium]
MAIQNRTQRFTIIAQDPSVKVRKKEGEPKSILTAQVDVPAEVLAAGPRGYRVQVVDYNSSTGELYAALDYKTLEGGAYCDPFVDEADSTLLNNPTFHAQNVYAIVMRTLARFEYALGRRVSWSFYGHQLLVAPHAFAEANAFYSKRDRSLLFGYFPKLSAAARGENGDEPSNGAKTKETEVPWVFTCLSHDIVVHETTHALVDGLRQRYMDPSSPEQAGFHEGLADVIALLSIFSLPGVVERVIDLGEPGEGDMHRIARKYLTVEALRRSVVLGLAEEFGRESSQGQSERSGMRKTALRRSVKLPPPSKLDPPRAPDYYMSLEEFEEPHRRGELLVAAMMNAFLEVWCKRLEALGDAPSAGRKRRRAGGVYLDRQRVIEEGANVADYLLTMSIRALDYTPPTDIEFCDFLSAILTADHEIRPDDSKYHFRKALLESFESYGMSPTSKGGGGEKGIWEAPGSTLNYARTRFESLTRDPDEVFRFIWENRGELGLEEDAYTRVLSVRPCLRTNPDDGFALHETVAEYYQQLNIEADELKQFGIKAPPEMLERFKGRDITVYGGGALIFDEFGQVKFHIRNRILNPERQTRRLKYLWKYGYFDLPEPGTAGAEARRERRFAEIHRRRFDIFPSRALQRRKDDDDGDNRKVEQWHEEFTEDDKEIDLDRRLEDLAGGQAGEGLEAV